jgi:ABC-2 type transport system permease protein
MRDWLVLRQLMWREVYARRKAYAAITGILVVIVVGASTFASTRTEEPDQFTIVHSIDLAEDFEQILLSYLAPDTGVTLERLPDPAAVDAALEADEANVGIVGPLQTRWGPNSPIGLENAVVAALQNVHIREEADRLGLSPDDLEGLLAGVWGSDVLGAESQASEVMSVLSVILSFVAIIAYGQWVAYGVMEEKNNRIIEIILGASRPQQILWAKILSIGSLGLSQFILVVGLGLGITLSLGEFDLPTVTVGFGVWLIVWFVLGFGFYAAIFAAAGSLAENSADASNSIGPIAIVPGLGYAFGLIMLSEPSPGIALQVMSWLPPWSPLLVPAMLARGWMSPLQGVASALVVVAAIWMVVRLAARIYAGGVSQSSRTLGWREAFRAGSDLLR